MKKIFFSIFILAVCSGALAENLGSFSWSQLKQERKLKAGFVLPPDNTAPFEQLKLTARSGPVTLLTIENPEITQTGINVSGQIKYQGVTQNGSLEMVVFFPGGRTFCVKAIGPDYFALNLRGSADWTRFFIMFFLSSNAREKPEKIQIQLNLPGQGVAFLSPLQFGQFNKGNPVQVTQGSFRNAFLVFLGLVLALTLSFRWTLSRYKPGKWTLAFLIPMMLMGSLLLAFGIFALSLTGQFITFAPFLFLGAGELLLPWVLKARAQLSYQ
jgi:hypothetical protein